MEEKQNQFSPCDVTYQFITDGPIFFVDDVISAFEPI